MKMVPEMTGEQRAQALDWVRAWGTAGPEMERMRREDIRRADTAASIPAFDGLFETAVRNYTPPPVSGLVEQQRYFRRASK